MLPSNPHRHPKIFVGTLYSGEAEFTECSLMIERQSGVEILHHVVRGLPEYEAHNALWEKWEAVKHKFDLFAKVDADTILIDEEAFSRVWQLFESDPDVTGAQILLHDYFTDGLIAGLNFMRPEVKLQKSASRLHADHADTGHRVVLKGEQVSHLAPIGWHAKNPSDIQSFRYGFHRMLKKQQETVEKVHKAWEKHGDRARLLALAGALSAYEAGKSGLTFPRFIRSILARLPRSTQKHNYTDESLIRDMKRLSADPLLIQKIQELQRNLGRMKQ